MGLLDMIDWGFFDIIIGPVISLIIKLFLTVILLIIGFVGFTRIPKPVGKIILFLIVIVIIGLVWIFL